MSEPASRFKRDSDPGEVSLLAIDCMADKIMAANSGNQKARQYVEARIQNLGGQLVVQCARCGSDVLPVLDHGKIAVQSPEDSFDQCTNIYPEDFNQPTFVIAAQASLFADENQ